MLHRKKHLVSKLLEEKLDEKNPGPVARVVPLETHEPREGEAWVMGDVCWFRIWDAFRNQGNGWKWQSL